MSNIILILIVIFIIIIVYQIILAKPNTLESFQGADATTIVQFATDIKQMQSDITTLQGQVKQLVQSNQNYTTQTVNNTPAS
jgi:type II secretory pathway component PulM